MNAGRRRGAGTASVRCLAALLAAGAAGCAGAPDVLREPEGLVPVGVLEATGGAAAPGAGSTLQASAPAGPAPNLVSSRLMADSNYLRIQRGLIQAELREQFQVTQLKDRSVLLGIASDNLFEFNSAEPRPNGLRVFDRIAKLVRDCDGYVIHVVGHTDNYGDEGANRWISHARAISVARYLAEQGVPAWRIQHEGRGSSEPLVRKASLAQRRVNRRVDVVIKPILEGREEEAWMPPLPLGASAAAR